MFKIASWNLNSVRSRLTHVTAWLKVRKPDVLLLQELKGTEFPAEAFKSLGYEAFQNNRGIRIDHFLLSPTLANRLEGCEIDKGPRAQEKPSDHTPIIVTLSDLP
jgi:exonuclease III